MGLFGRKESYKGKKSLIIYFSRADENYAVGYIDKGNTEIIAEYVKEFTGADMFKAEPVVPYSKDYKTCIEEAKKRVGNAPITENLPSLSEYEVIYIMTPIYWGTYAPELETALKEGNFKGKTIRIITTHEGSGLANVPNDVKRVCTGADVLNDSIAIRGADCKNARNKIENWV